jgi:hypothetical protein
MQTYQNPAGIRTTNLRRNIVLITIFLVITPIVLAATLFSLSVLVKIQAEDSSLITTSQLSTLSPKSGARVYASLPSQFPSISAEAETADARVGLIKKYLSDNYSPLEPYAANIVESADRYGVDYRLTTAIAKKESGLCNIIPEESYNCWGWGIHSQGTLKFSSFPEAIETVTRGLKEDYFDLGYTTIEEIMAKYTPLSNGTWAEGVLYYMEQIQ